MYSLRVATKHSRTLSAQLRVAPSHTRTFFSPFPASNKSPLTTPPSASPTSTDKPSTVYVVSEPDASDRPYSVPSGAFPTSAPFIDFPQSTSAPNPGGNNVSSTSPNRAHPNLTKRVPHNEAGVGDSAAVRNHEAPGELAAKGGGYGGLGLMDEGTTRAPESGELAERNPPPIGEVGEEISRKGLKEAWKDRK